MGILAMAGAAGGLGQGAVEVGQQGQKMDLLKKQNDLAQMRETAIANLRASHEAALQQAGFGQQEKMVGKEEEFTAGQTQVKLGAASRAAGATREFEAAQNKAKLASEEKRTGISAGARVEAQRVRGEYQLKANENKPGKPRFEFHQAQTTNLDPRMGPVGANSKTLLYDHKTGQAFELQGDKYLPAGTNPASINRNVPANEMGDLIRDPNGTIPSGPNKGMLKADAFQNTYHFLPKQVVSAWASGQGNEQAAPGENSLPPNVLKQVGATSSTRTGTGFGPGASSGEDNSDEGAADNAAQADEESSSNSPAFQSNAMNSYGNMQ